MVSRSTGPLRKILPAVAVGLAAVLVGCGSGQVTQTDSMPPAVNGNSAEVGGIKLRDVLVARSANGTYREGDDAPLLLSIINDSETDDRLIAVTSPAIEGEAELIGDTDLPAYTAIEVIRPTAGSAGGAEATTTTTVPEQSVTDPSPPAATGDATTGATPSDGSSAPQTTDSTVTQTPSGTPPLPDVGVLHIILRGLITDLPVGRNVPVTFVFAEAGQVTLQLPIANPSTVRDNPPAEAEGGH